MRECNSCGKCCIKYGNGRLSASEQDFSIWASFKPEISAYVKNQEIWFSPTTGDLLEKCPWLRRENGQERYTCAIYYDRPEDCRAYPANLTDMINDECEMLEEADFANLRAAEAARAKIADGS